MPSSAIDPKAKKPAPAACADCSKSAKPGEKVPVPVLESETEKQRQYRCPKCGLLHIVGNPASTYGS
ncbi:MAG TPA: hypothetical protein VIX73_23120 [Kofleriaceae bacterium]|jgi:DNA-directed RNA polymerase subunit RPC12/RpoP